jgi:hypothetical protein
MTTFFDVLGDPGRRSGEGGVWIWLDEDGVWHVWGTADGSGHTFQGYIYPLGDMGARFRDVVERQLGANDVLEVDGGQLYFEFRVNGVGADGVEFRIEGEHEGLGFELWDNGEEIDTEFVFMGERRWMPTSSHFSIRCCLGDEEPVIPPDDEPPVVVPPGDESVFFQVSVKDEDIEMECVVLPRGGDVEKVVWLRNGRVGMRLRDYVIVPREILRWEDMDSTQ